MQPLTTSNNNPKIGLALSGASGRAVAHIGVLEVLQENNIPIDYITACSSGTIIAASYACNTLEQLKRDWLRLDRQFLLSMLALEKTGGGVLSMEKFAKWAENYLHGKKFEDVKPVLGFVCVDIQTSAPVVLSLGDIARACQASCTVPGLFEPIEWGNHVLVDGGLFSIIPTTQAKELGADFIIGVDIAATRYMFLRQLFPIRKGYNFVKRSFPIKMYLALHGFLDSVFTKSARALFYNQSDFLAETNLDRPSTFAILGKAMDIAITNYEKQREIIADCDYLITPRIKHLGKTDFKNSRLMIEEGRRAALAAIPEIKQHLKEFMWRKQARKSSAIKRKLT